MKYTFAGRVAALALTVLLAGCAAQAPAGPQRALVNRPGDFEQLPEFAPEAPEISADVRLPQPLAVQANSRKTYTPAAVPDEVRAVWISYLEMGDLLYQKTQRQFRANIAQAFDNIRDLGLNTVIVQVRPFGDALYDSDYFPWSHVITGTEGKAPGFDPTQVMVEEARARGLRFEAWLNPYRVRSTEGKVPLSTDNPARKWLEQGTRHVLRYNGAVSYNPASTAAQELIVKGVREIVRKYAVDGIHIDDYFYPTADLAFDKADYDAYCENGGTLAQADWRRKNVETLVRAIYQAVKEENPNVLFGISPQSSIDNNYSQQFLDVRKITAADGYCDYIMPQIYFGFENQAQPYAETLASWSRMVRAPGVKLYAGLAAYKIGAVDTWAGAGKNEWVENDDLLARMLTECRGVQNYGGFALYRYDSVFRPAPAVQQQTGREVKNFRRVLEQ